MARMDEINDLAGIGAVPVAASIPAELTATELAPLLGVSIRHLQTLATNGVVPIAGRNRYPARACITAYCAYIHARRAPDDLDAAKLALAKANAEKVELQNATARRELIPAAVVRAEWLSLAADLRNRVLAVPQRIAARLALDRSTAAALDRELREALSDLSRPEGRTDDLA